ncbi:MAG TPA: hypothetical protein P5270_00610 [Victivallales bacterium]|nr:hypothetical protein [Victivallales bacterium]HPO91062.1 hypothetical protein [Victivallales bacterium]HRR27841.1 hypothetical protein [Victivallales bacterium]
MTSEPKKNSKFNTRPPIATRSHIAFRKPTQQTKNSIPQLPKQPIPSPSHQEVTKNQAAFTPPPPPPPPPTIVQQQTSIQPTTEPPQKESKRLVGIPIKIPNQFAQRTGMIDKGTSIEAPPLQNKDTESNFTEITEQIQNYLEVCDTLSRRPIDMEYLTELLFVFTKSLNFDFLVILCVGKNNSFSTYISRGLKGEYPNFQNIFAKTISEGRVIWPEVMHITSAKDKEIAKWINKQKIFSFGYVPFQDGNNILGFMIIGSYSKKTKSPIASQLLELCGGRIGLALAHDLLLKERNEQISSLISELDNEFSQIKEYSELLESSFQDKESLAGKLIRKCNESLKRAGENISNLKLLNKKN